VRGVLLELQRLLPGLWGGLSGEATQCSTGGGPVGICGGCWCLEDSWSADMAMDQYLLIPFLMWWTSINPSYFDVHQGYKVLTHCQIIWKIRNSAHFFSEPLVEDDHESLTLRSLHSCGLISLARSFFIPFPTSGRSRQWQSNLCICRILQYSACQKYMISIPNIIPADLTLSYISTFISDIDLPHIPV